jgi:hypothetical protein
VQEIGKTKLKGEVVMLKMSYSLARAAGWDEGDKNMKKNGRTMWNEDDWNASCRKFYELMQFITDEETKE